MKKKSKKPPKKQKSGFNKVTVDPIMSPFYERPKGWWEQKRIWLDCDTGWRPIPHVVNFWTRLKKRFSKPVRSERQKAIEWELQHRQDLKRTCLHFRTNSDGSYNWDKFNLHWMKHSDGVIRGVCGTCFSQFDVRDPRDMAIFQDPRNAKKRNYMGEACQNPVEVPKKKSFWKKVWDAIRFVRS